MGRVYLIRHGETDSNTQKRFQGRIDIPLNPNGMSQVGCLTEFMKEKKLDAIYCSSMLRARMTAAPLAMSHNMGYKPLELLQEVSFGDWEGLSFDEISTRWPKEMQTFFTNPGEWVPPNGETFPEVAERCQKAFDMIFAEQGHDKNIAIVSHGGIIRVQLCLLLGMPLNNLWRLGVHNVSVSSLTDWQGNMVVETVNDTHFCKKR